VASAVMHQIIEMARESEFRMNDRSSGFTRLPALD
jgi:hypothetical protein